MEDHDRPSPSWPRLARFYGLAVFVAWTWWGSLIVRGVQSPDSFLDSHLPGLASPALAALISAGLDGGWSGVKTLLAGLFRKWKNPLLITATILLTPAIAALMLWVTGTQVGPEVLTAYPGVPPGTGLVTGVLVALLLNAIGEEMGWRSYLLPGLVSLGKSRAALVVAAMWAFWHIPLFFLPFGLGSDVLGFAIVGWVIGLTAGSYVLGWVWFTSGGSITAVALWHLLFNYASSTTATHGAPAAAASTAVMVMALWIAVIWWRQGHIDD